MRANSLIDNNGKLLIKKNFSVGILGNLVVAFRISNFPFVAWSLVSFQHFKAHIKSMFEIIKEALQVDQIITHKYQPYSVKREILAGITTSLYCLVQIVV